jgi:hypothetical protein
MTSSFDNVSAGFAIQFDITSSDTSGAPMPQEPTGNQVDKMVTLSKSIVALLEEAGIQTSVIILENPSPTGPDDKLMVNLGGHRYDATKICCVVASRLRSQIAAELGDQD